MTHSDAAFFIGKTHAVCEDYAFAPPPSEPTPPRFQSVWLSDGCSSSPHTDVGARLLVHTMQTHLPDFDAVHGVKTAQKQQAALEKLVCKAVCDAQQSAARVGVTKASLDATLLGLVETGGASDEEKVLYAFLYGDGALVLGLTDDTKIIYRSQYGAGYPFYPAYLEDAGRLTQWQNVEGNIHRITETTLDANGRVCSEREFTPSYDAPYHFLRRPVAGLRFAAVLSDGIESFQRRTETDTTASFEAVPYLEVVKELTAFKQWKGEFAQRRMQAFGKACAARLGWHHNDDVSMAAMYFGD